MIKIDVEGFEMEVLKGASKILENTSLKALIVEINGCCNKYNVSEKDIHKEICSFGFSAIDYNPFTREIFKKDSFSPNGNTIYVRELEFIMERLINSVKIKVLNTIV